MNSHYNIENISQKENKGISSINQQMKNLLNSLDVLSDDQSPDKLINTEMKENERKFEEKYLNSNISMPNNQENKFEEKYLRSNVHESINLKNNELNDRSFSVVQETNYRLEKEEVQNNFKVKKINIYE